MATEAATRRRSNVENNKPYLEVVWVRNENFEAMMKANMPHVRYTFHDSVSASEVNVELSRRNQARLGAPISKDHVQTLLSLNQVQKLFLPGVVFRRLENARRGSCVVLADGNHRDEFCRVRRPQITSYSGYELLGCGEETFNQIAKMCNALNGRMSDTAERLQHAVDTYLNSKDSNKSIRVIAERFGITHHRLADHIKATELRARFLPDGDLPVPRYENLVRKTGMMVTLGRIPNNKVLHRLALGVSEFSDPPIGKIDDAVNEVLSVRTSESDQLAKVDEVLAELSKHIARTRGRVNVPGTPLLVEIKRCLKFTNSIVNSQGDVKDLVAEEIRDELTESISNLRKNISFIQRELKADE